MKQTLLATLLAGLFVSTTAFAGAQITFEGEYENVTNATNRDVTGFNIIPAYKFTDGALAGVTVDLKAQIQDVVDSHTSGGNVEPRVRYDYDLSRYGVKGLSVWGRVGLGERVSSGANFGYYTVESGVAYTVNDKVKLSLSDRYRDAFGSDHAYQTNTVRAGGSYALTKVDSLGVTVYEKYQDTQSTGVEVSYTRSF